MQFDFVSIIILLFVVFVLIFAGKLLVDWHNSKINKNLKFDIFLIKIPHFTESEKQGQTPDYVQKSLAKIENMFAAVSGIKAEHPWLQARREIFSLEIVSIAGSISFYAVVPKKWRDFFIQQTQAVYPKVHFEEISDYNIFWPHSQIAGGDLRLTNDYSLPIKTYRSFESDPLESITNSLSKLSEEESAAVQYVFCSAPKAWHARGRKIAQKMYKGLSFGKAASAVGGGNFWDKTGKTFEFIFSFFATTKKQDPMSFEQKNKNKQELSTMEQERIKGMEQKTSKSGMYVNIRVITAAKTDERSKNILSDILNSYSQYNIYEFGNSFRANVYHHADKLVDQFIYRSFIPKHKILLNSEEMASVIHLPLPTTETPNIQWLEASKLPPPSNLPKEGLYLGDNIYRGKNMPVFMKPEDRRRHLYIIGQTGTGKSVFQESLVIQDIKAGHGVCLVDPHGDLVEKVLTHVPPERAEDVIVFDPSDIEYPLGLNMLEYQNDDQKSFMINEMIMIFDKLYDLKTTGGPMFEQYMRNAMLLVMDDKESGATLLEIPKVLADPEYRKNKLAKVRNQFTRDFWEKEAQKAGGEAALANMVPYITSKLTPFIANETIRPIIAQTKSAFNFREAMDSHKIILINLSKGKIGEMNSNLLGMIVIGKLLYAAMSRVDIYEAERSDFYLYIDEFQNFITDSISIILSEARKYRLNLILAHQFIGQLIKPNNTRTRDAIFGNVGSIAAFRIGVEDAEILAKQMAPVVSVYDLINMPKYTCYLRLLIDNANPPSFNISPQMPPKGNFELAQNIKQLSRQKYGRPRAQIEAEIEQRSKI